ncbi:MAG: right-handed parallel beta-helix repeat-containing protein [Nitrospinae bacterium]|nr:right-handed parallel beta-helix repeat-containing protein [Nitrospinota bacterium]
MTTTNISKKTFIVFLIAFSVILFVAIRLLPHMDKISISQPPMIITEFTVMSLSDHGPDTLRDVINRVNRQQASARIIFKSEGSIRLEEPLPALISDGATLDGGGKIRIDASEISETGYAWTLKGDGQTVLGLAIAGKGGNGLLMLSKNSGVEKCVFDGLGIAISIGANHVYVKDSVFSKNVIAVEVLDEAQFSDITANKIRNSKKSAVWAVWKQRKTPALLKIEKNEVSGNETGVVLAVENAKLLGNHMTSNKVAVHALSSNSIEIIANEIYQNTQQGIVLEETTVSSVSRNSIYQNGISGLLMKRSPGNRIDGNQIYSNGAYGVAEVMSNAKSSILHNSITGNFISDNGDGIYMAASSPLIKDNIITKNRTSGIMIQDRAAGASGITSNPRIETQREMTDSVKGGPNE